MASATHLKHLTLNALRRKPSQMSGKLLPPSVKSILAVRAHISSNFSTTSGPKGNDEKPLLNKDSAATIESKPPAGFDVGADFAELLSTISKTDVTRGFAVEGSNFASFYPKEQIIASSVTNDDDRKFEHAEFDWTRFQSLDRKKLWLLASKRASDINLAFLHRYSSSTPDQCLRNAQFLHQELPVRLAQCVVELMVLPHGLSRSRPVQPIIEQFVGVLEEIERAARPQSAAEESEFAELICPLVRHDPADIAESIAMGLEELQNKGDMDAARVVGIDRALDRFFAEYIGARLLIEHHIFSRTASTVPSESSGSSSGSVGRNVDVAAEIRRIVCQVNQECLQSTGFAPVIEIVDRTKPEHAKRPFTCVNSHFHHILKQVVSHACRAVASARKERDGHDDNFPPMEIVLVKGEEDLVIKISHEGGGICRSICEKTLHFASPGLDPEDEEGGQGANLKTQRLWNLPLARLYSQHFGGDLVFNTLEGRGKDIYIYLPMKEDSCEELPRTAKCLDLNGN